MTRKMGSLLLAAALLAGMSMLGGCGKKGEEKAIENAIEKGTGGKASVDLDKGQMTIQTKEGETIQVADGGGNLRVPDDFPKDVLVYPGTKVEGSIKAGGMTQLSLRTSDAVAKVADEYKSQMEKSGWKEETSASSPGGTMRQYTKDQRRARVHIRWEAKGTLIVLTMSKEKGSAK